MNETLREVKNFLAETWIETPWVRAAGILASTVAGLVFLNSALPHGIAMEFDSLESDVYQMILTSLLVLYFFFSICLFRG